MGEKTTTINTEKGKKNCVCVYEYEIVSLGMKGGCGWLGLLFLLGVRSKQPRLCHVPRPTQAEWKHGMGGA